MAKQALSVLMHFASIAWITALNFRKEYGDTDKLKVSLAENEWVNDNSVPVFPVEKDNPDHQAMLKSEMERRQSVWDSLKVAQDVDGLAKKQVFEQLYVEKGKLIVPEYFGNAGFRRASVFFTAMVERFKNRSTPGHEEDTISGNVPARPVTYKNIVERLIDQQQENELQWVGNKKMTDLEKLQVAWTIFENGGREMDVRRLYTSTTGQKLFGTCQANVNWPRLRIIERIALEPSHPDRIRFSSVRHDDLVKMNNRYEADRKRADGLPLNEKQRSLEPITESEVDDYFRDKSKGEGDGSAPKITTKKNMEQYARGHKLLIVRKTMDSVLNDTQQNLQRYISNPDPLNDVVNLIDEGNGDAIRSVTAATKADVLLMTKCAQIVINGGDGATKLTALANSILNLPATVPATVPVEQTAAPVEQTAAPVEQTAAPVEQTAAPVKQTAGAGSKKRS